LTKENASLALEKLKELCPRPIITGVTDENSVSVFYWTEQGVQEYIHANVEGFFCGAGDVFTSAFVGCLANGKSEENAIKLSSDFAAAAIRRSAKEVDDKRFGLNFEAEIFTFLKNLHSEA
jgi:pyridoxine kinase